MPRSPRALTESEQATIDALCKAYADNDEQQIRTLALEINDSYNVPLIKAKSRVENDFVVEKTKEIHRGGRTFNPTPPPPPEGATPEEVADWNKAVYAIAEKAGFRFSQGLIRRRPVNIAKYSPAGGFIGWYREGQKSGKPSAKMPIEREVEDAQNRYLAEIGRMRFEFGKAGAGVRSARSRGSVGRAAETILDGLKCSSGERTKRLWSELEKQGFQVTSIRQVQRYVRAWKEKLKKRHEQEPKFPLGK